MTALHRQVPILDRAIKLLAGGTIYEELAVPGDEVVGVMLCWHDATTSGTFTIESTNWDRTKAAVASTALDEWYPEASLTIVSPSASAAGSDMVHIGNVGAKRFRVKYVPAANSIISIVAHGKS